MKLPHFAASRTGTSRVRRRLMKTSSGCAGAIIAFTAPCLGQTTRATTAPATQPTTAETQLAPEAATTKQPSDLKQMSLDQLLATPVTLVSREPQPISESPSAIQVITGEEIKRSGFLSLPEALELAPNLQVAQVNAHDWAITARGFNGIENGSPISNKLLVMIDGRSVYSPLFGGVFWDVQNVLMEDVDRIEVVSGPGTTMWGENAVNGVINVVSKSSRDTQGLYINQDLGSFWQDYTAVRYGGQITDNLFYRIYAMGFTHDGTETASDANNGDSWYMKQTGFRMDYYPNTESTLTFQGDAYDGVEGVNVNEEDSVSGGNLLTRFSHTFSEKSDLNVQMYFDYTSRELSSPNFHDQIRTFDIQAQHRLPLGDWQSITYGFDLRLAQDQDVNVPALSFYPADRSLPMYSGFVQDQITIIPKKLDLTLGTKLEDNIYTGLEYDPSARLAWYPSHRQTIWAAVSRAVRTPTRFDEDEVAGGTVLATPNRDFESEKVIAYELGYRVRPVDPLSLSIATFFNHYTDLRSVDINTAPPPSYVFANHREADTYGVELSADLQLATWWHMRGGYTYLDENLWRTSDEVLPLSEQFEVNDPYNQVMLQSLMDLPAHLQLDTVLRYVDALKLPATPAYLSLDVRLAWHYKNVELALVGQNLLDNSHPEFGSDEIPRSYYGSLTIRW